VRHRSRRAVTSPVVTALALLAGTAHAAPGAQAPAPPASPPSVPAATSASLAEVPDIAWEPCGEAFPGVDCARVEVPLDHREPDGDTVSLQLTRVAATAAPEDRLGTLFINPGGPGGSGALTVANAGQLFAQGTQGRFDVVGFDPRGIAASDPLRCFPDGDAQLGFILQQPFFPWRGAQFRSYYDHGQELTARCLAQDAPVRDHMSTADVARDLDLLRQAVGDEQLTYLGFSYGSYIGNTYANLFPDNVRALVIDGVLDPEAWAGGTHPQDYDAESTEATIGEFFRTCAEAGPDACAFAEGGRLAQRYEAIARSLERRDLVVDLGDDGSFVFTYDELIANMVSAMYAPAAWPSLAELLDEVEDLVAGRLGAGPRAAAARDSLRDTLAPLDETPVGATDFPPSYSNGYEGYFGNYCADSDQPLRFGTWVATGNLTERISRTGPYWWWYNVPCATWPTAETRYTGPWTADTSQTVLVVGNLFDPATAYGSAVRSDELLGDSRLLTYAGWGHTAYGATACVTDAIDAYLVDVEVPPEGTVCPAAPNPFLAAQDVGAAAASLDLPVGRPPAWWLR
jgi:pimeloyl-ACP methyl ester carboxylesterase